MRKVFDRLWAKCGPRARGYPASIAHREPKSAVIMVTHTLGPRILAHFDRLKRESGLPTFLAYHVGKGRKSGIADLNVTNWNIRWVFPVRLAQMRAVRRKISRGYADLVTLTAALKPALNDFDRIWILEYDVDFSGHWSAFFAEYADSRADVLVANIREQSDDPEWHHWKSFHHPPGLHRFASLQPAARYSRRFLVAYHDHMLDNRWAGHHEATITTLAASLNMKMEDIFGSGTFAAARPHCMVDLSTFSWHPVQSAYYFYERPEAFAKRDALYHPVKLAS